MNRRLNLAVVASLVLHGALLVLLPLLDGTPPPPPKPAMTARLVEKPRPTPPAPAPAPPAPPEAKPAPPQVKPAPKPKPPVEPPKPRADTPRPVVQAPPVITAPPVPQPAPAPSVAPPPPAPAAPAPPAPPAPSPSPPQVASAAPSSAAPSSAASSAQSEAATISQYRLQIMELAGRYKRYPRIAQDNNWTGTAEVRLEISPTGAISVLNVRKGSGHAVLDSEALNMIRTAFGKAPVPEGLRGKSFTIDVPVIFSLKDE